MAINDITEFEVLHEIGGRIRDLRIKKNMTQEELAGKSGISYSTLNRIEKGEDTKFSNLIRILIQLGQAENFEYLIPKMMPDFEKLYMGQKTRQRVRKKKQTDTKPWRWGEDDE